MADITKGNKMLKIFTYQLHCSNICLVKFGPGFLAVLQKFCVSLLDHLKFK